MMNFTPFPKLSTKRLKLRALSLDDENEILFMRSDEGMLEFIDIPKAKTLEDARVYIKMIVGGVEENKWAFWGIVLNEAIDKLIGTICLWNLSIEENRAEIGYVLHPDFWGKGIMQEAAEVVIDYGFNTMKLDTIVAHLNPNNVKSIKLLERTHFIFEKKLDKMAVYTLVRN